jgi:PAS domain-containing protein
MPGASGGMAIITFFLINAAVNGSGPFYGMTASETAYLLQQFLLVRAVPLYLFAILIQQKETVEHSLRESEQRFRNLADKAPVLIWMSGTDKLCDFFNQGWLEFTGRTLQQELGKVGRKACIRMICAGAWTFTFPRLMRGSRSRWNTGCGGMTGNIDGYWTVASRDMEAEGNLSVTSVPSLT